MQRLALHILGGHAAGPERWTVACVILHLMEGVAPEPAPLRGHVSAYALAGAAFAVLREP